MKIFTRNPHFHAWMTKTHTVLHSSKTNHETVCFINFFFCCISRPSVQGYAKCFGGEKFRVKWIPSQFHRPSHTRLWMRQKWTFCALIYWEICHSKADNLWDNMILTRYAFKKWGMWLIIYYMCATPNVLFCIFVANERKS